MARLGRGFPNNFSIRPMRRLPQIFLGSQPAFANVTNSSIGQQPLYAGGLALSLSGSLPSHACGLDVLTAQQAIHSMVVIDFLTSTAIYTSGEAQAFLASQPAYGVVRASLIGAQPLHGTVRPQMVSAQPLFAPVGATWNTQGMMVRSFPALTVTPNVVAQQYKPVQAVEITLGSEAQYGEAQYGETQYGGN